MKINHALFCWPVVLAGFFMFGCTATAPVPPPADAWMFVMVVRQGTLPPHYFATQAACEDARAAVLEYIPAMDVAGSWCLPLRIGMTA